MSGAVAIDCDLRSLTAWHDESGLLAYQTPAMTDLWMKIATVRPDMILFEVASPQFYDDNSRAGKAMRYNKLRWALFNCYALGCLCEWWRVWGHPGTLVLVAPSSLWTRGYSEEVRHKMAKVTSTKHDSRECEAMLAFHLLYPLAWDPASRYMGEL